MTTTIRPRSVTRPAFAPGRAWVARLALLLTGVSTLGGCYTSVPVVSAPAPGTTLFLDLSDRGRVALADSIGPSASRIEGVVQASSESSYVLRVSSVQYLSGQSNSWSGEQVTVRTDLIDSIRERRFSRSRSVVLGLGAAAAVVALALATELVGSGSQEKPTPIIPPLPGQ